MCSSHWSMHASICPLYNQCPCGSDDSPVAFTYQRPCRVWICTQQSAIRTERKFDGNPDAAGSDAVRAGDEEFVGRTTTSATIRSVHVRTETIEVERITTIRSVADKIERIEVSSDGEEESPGLGGAQITAIVVAIMVVIFMLLACFLVS